MAVAPARFGLLVVGKRRDYRCTRCGKTFVVRSPGHVVFTLLHATFVTGLGALILVASLLSDSPGDGAPLGGVLLLGGLGLLAWAITKLVARLTHPLS